MPLPRSKPINEKPKQTKLNALQRIEQRFEGEAGVWREGEIIHLDGWRTITFKESSEQINAITELTVPTVCLCRASAPELVKNGSTGLRTVRDVPFHFKPVKIYYRAQRYLCSKCKRSVQQPAIGVHPSHLMTERLVNYLAAKAFDLRSNFAGVARETGVSERTIRNIFTDYAVSLEHRAISETPAWLAIDEVYPARNKRECTAVTDPVEKKVVNLIKRNKTENFEFWLRQLPDPERLEVVTMDLCPVYRATVKRVLPQVALVADRFHVQNLLNQTLKDVLAVIRARLTVTEHKEYMRRRSLLLKSRHHLSETVRGSEGRSEAEVVEEWFKRLPALAIAYELKEEFADILQLACRERASLRADAWLIQISNFAVFFAQKYENQCRRLSKYPFKNVIETFSEWRGEILNYIDYRDRFPIKATNAFAEMANGKIKEANRLGKGYNFEVLRMKLLYGALMANQISPHFARGSEFYNSSPPMPTLGVAGKSNDSNLARLEEARESRDEIKKLIENPRENGAWSARFADAGQAPHSPLGQGTAQGTESKSARQINSSDEAQMNLFQDR